MHVSYSAVMLRDSILGSIYQGISCFTPAHGGQKDGQPLYDHFQFLMGAFM